MTVAEKLYFKYEYLAKKYANKIFSYEELSYDYEDLLQEFRLKIFTSIKSYGRRYAKYLRGEAPKPVHIRFYLEAACGNKSRDFIKYISRENHKISIDNLKYDFGIVDDSVIDPIRNRFVINDVNLLEGLTGKEKAVFSLYLRGYTSVTFLRKVYFSNSREKAIKREVAANDEPIDVTDIIEMQKNYLKVKYGNDLLRQRTVYSSYSLDNDD